MPKTIAIVGPTGVGKTDVSIPIAEKLGGEIVSADSRQLYTGMDIGTDKVSHDKRRRIPHHLIDVLPPTALCDAATYACLARRAIDDIVSRGNIPMVVGGSGFYISALFFGLSPLPSASESLRRELREQAADQGWSSLYEKLVDVDPETARKIHPNDHYRVMRSLEVYYMTGAKPSVLRNQEDRAPEDVTFFVLARDRQELYERIDARVERMIDQGLINETESLLKTYGENEVLLSTVGYREVVGFLNGEYELGEAVDRAKTTSRNLAKRQLTWFRKLDRAEWIDLSSAGPDEAVEVVSSRGIGP